MFSYQKIVFGIKHRHHINVVLKVLERPLPCSFLIYQHNAKDTDNFCYRPDVHYHGVVEFSNGEGKIEKLFNQLRLYCIYFNAAKCSSPVEYLAYMTLEPKRYVAREILNSSELLNHLQTAMNMKLEVMKKKSEKRLSLLGEQDIINKIVDSFLKTGNLFINLSRFDINESVWAPLKERLNEINLIISPEMLETALNISKKIVLTRSILTLSSSFEWQDGYLSPEESVRFVLNWCSHQELDPKEFIKNLIRCLDKKGGNRNSIYLQGARNSGKSYIVESIVEACIHVGEVVVESTAHSFVWEECVDKRLIVMKEPHFSKINFDQLDRILSGSGTAIYKHNTYGDYLQPTPVIIVANEHDWTDNPELSAKIIKRFIGCYMDLKYFPTKPEKKLHPQWLSLLNKTLSGKKGPKAIEMISETSGRTSMKSKLHTNNGKQLIVEERQDDGGKASTSSMITKQAPENAMHSNPQRKKRPMPDNGHDVGRNKMKRVDEIVDESKKEAGCYRGTESWKLWKGKSDLNGA